MTDTITIRREDLDVLIDSLFKKRKRWEGEVEFEGRTFRAIEVFSDDIEERSPAQARELIRLAIEMKKQGRTEREIFDALGLGT
jgi:hypothetical protein